MVGARVAAKTGSGSAPLACITLDEDNDPYLSKIME